jgi:nicotinamide-nucleotide amidase
MGMNESILQLGELMRARDGVIVTAESCTGGGIATALTDVAGSSVWFDRGFVTYSNAAKEQMLGVPRATIVEYGAVSEAVVIAMAQGALQASGADLAVSVSGVAGPGGGSEHKPVGTVWLAWIWRDAPPVAGHRFYTGNRSQIREQAVDDAVQGLLQIARAE